MTDEELDALTEAFIDRHSKPYIWDKDMVLVKRDTSATAWAVSQLADVLEKDPEAIWSFIQEVLRRDPPADVIAVLAAGPLEDYLAKYGQDVIARVEAQASGDPKFRHLLGGVWKSTMSDEVWARVQACCDRSGWTF